MTQEEAIEFGNMWLQINEDCKDSSTYAFFQMAIRSFGAWDKVINTLKNWSDAKVSPKQRDIYFDCIELIEQTIKREVTDNLPGAEMAVKNDKKIACCKNCDRWKQKDNDGNYICFSDEGRCNCWNVYTGENYFCADFIEQKRGDAE